MMKKVMVTVLATLFVMGTLVLNAQTRTTVTLPSVSQKASVTQRVGLTDITIVYHSPAVKKREILGKLLPFEKMWRAGANENTTITFTDDVSIEGQAIKKGTYGLFMIPGKESWEIVFSKNHTSWGNFFYKKEEDALRVNVSSHEVPHREWLSYEFRKREAESVVASLNWSTFQVPFKIEVDVKTIVVANLRKEVRTLPWYFWQGSHGAAKYCLDNEVNLEEGFQWALRSIKVKETFTNTMLKVKYMEKQGKTAEAAVVKRHAHNIANEQDLTGYAYSFALKDRPRCEQILTDNIKRFKTWSSYNAFARYYGYFKDKKNALKYYKLALKKAPADKKEQLQKAIKKLG